MKTSPILVTFASVAMLAAGLAPALAAPTPSATPSATPSVTATPASPAPTPTASTTATPTPTATPSVTPSVTPTAKETPAVKQVVTATYECGAAHFTNPIDRPVTIIYGTAQTDDVEGRVTIPAKDSKTVESTNKQFGWTAWPDTAGAPDQSGDDVGHRWLPGEDLSCDEPNDEEPTDTTLPPSATPRPDSRGLANTGN